MNGQYLGPCYVSHWHHVTENGNCLSQAISCAVLKDEYE
jgi:hypothetical protein